MSIVSHVHLRTCTDARAQQHAQRKTSSCITTCHLDAYFVPIFGKWPHSRTMTSYIVRGCQGNHALWPLFHQSSCLIRSSTKSPKPVARILQVFCQTVFITVHGNFHIVYSVHCKSWKLARRLWPNAVVRQKMLQNTSLPLNHSLHIPVIIVVLKCSHNL
jgi:hypothetical protein